MIRFIVTSLFIIASLAINAQEYIYRKVTSKSQIEAGGVYVLARGGDTFYYATSNGTSITASSANVITQDEFFKNDACELTFVTADAETFYIKTNDGKYLLNELKISPNMGQSENTWRVNVDTSTGDILMQIKEHTKIYVWFYNSKFNYPKKEPTTHYPVILYRKYAKASVTTSGYSSFCASSDLDFTGSDIKAYTGTVSGDELLMTETSKVKANQGVILFSETSGKEDNIKVKVMTDAENADFPANDIIGVTSEAGLTVDGNGIYYVLADKNNEVAFYPVNTGVVIPKGKAYLHVTSGNNPAKVSFMSLTPTTLSTERHTETPKDAYNLSGQKVGSGYHGIVITNGRKVIK